MSIVHASIDENKTIKGGKAGDQTGKEVCVRSYYKIGNVMLRYFDQNVANKAVEIAVKLANSNLVGYDQGQRNTLYTQLSKNNFDVDKYIASGVKSETDCSAFIYAVWCCLVPSLRSNTNAPTTSTMRKKFIANGFKAYTDSKYLSSDKYLNVGDVLVNEGHHVVMNISGNNVGGDTSSNAIYYPKYSGTSGSIITVLSSVGEKDTSYAHRTRIALANGVNDYKGTLLQNTLLVSLCKQGKLKKA